MINAVLNETLNANTVRNISQQLGTDESSTSMAIQAALPMLIGALARNSSTPEGAQSLHGALSRDHDGGILDDLIGFIGNSGAGPGNGILGHIFGGRREAVEQGVSQSSGLDMGTVSQLLIMLAPIVMGALGRAQRQQGLDLGGVAETLEQERQQAESASPFGGMLSQILDRNQDGQVLDDLANIAGKFFQNRG